VENHGSQDFTSRSDTNMTVLRVENELYYPHEVHNKANVVEGLMNPITVNVRFLHFFCLGQSYFSSIQIAHKTQHFGGLQDAHSGVMGREEGEGQQGPAFVRYCVFVQPNSSIIRHILIFELLSETLTTRKRKRKLWRRLRRRRRYTPPYS
jgi:hypothetical protein